MICLPRLVLPCTLLPAAAGLLCLHAFSTSDQDATPADMPLVYEQTFTDEHAIRDFIFANPPQWSVREHDGGRHLYHGHGTRYQPPLRSPRNVAVIAPKKFGSFVLDVEMLSTGRDVPHRDMCIFWGMTDPSTFYYVHISRDADNVAHQIYLLNNEPRQVITGHRNDGVPWRDDQWHHVRLVRDVEQGVIRVYFDDMATPIMTANDKTLGEGYIGLGSFDDAGGFTNIRIRARQSREERADFFPAE